jgi:hypothetical protein
LEPQLSTRWCRTSRVSLRSAKRPSTQFANTTKYKISTDKVLRTRMPFKGRSATALLTSSQARVLVIQASIAAYLTRFTIIFFPMIHSTRENKEMTTNELRTRTAFHMSSTKNSFFGSQIVGFASKPSHLNYWLLHPFFYKEATCKGSTIKRLPYPAKAVPSKDYFTHLTLTIARKGCWVISPDYCMSQPQHFCAVGDIVNQRYDVLCDWLWDACHMAGVPWGSRCKGFCSKEGLHYRLEQSARKLS